MREITTAPAQGGPTTTDSASNNSTHIRLRLSARQRRALVALLERPRSREEIDKIAGVSNGPDLIAQLRRHGLEIPCELVEHIDRDDKRGRHGVYHLSGTDREYLGGAL